VDCPHPPGACGCADDRERRRPEESTLYKTVAAGLNGFLEQREAHGRAVPWFVRRALHGFLKCGLLEHGFCRLVCDDCRKEEVVAFSCKDRGFCPSCMGRRMNDTAAHLVDRVLPDVKIRQWVLSLPVQIRMTCAFKPKALSAVLREFTRAVFAYQRWKARKLGLQNPRCGAVTAVQRFGSAADLNIHFHTLVLDGVYTDGAVFHALAPPTSVELARLTRTVAKKAGKALVRMGFGDDDAIGRLAEAEPEVAALVAESVAFPRERVIDSDLARPGQASAQHLHFNLHAGTTVKAGDKGARERLCRSPFGLNAFGGYRHLGILRPPISDDRLTQLPDGKVTLALKTPWRDGTVGIVLTAIELVARLAALVPRPGQNLVRYHGVLAANAGEREDIVPGGQDRAGRAQQETIEDGRVVPPQPPPLPPTPRKHGRYLEWAALMVRVFLIDPLRCSCGGRLRLVAMVMDGAGAHRYLRGTGLATDAQRARPPPTTVLETEAPA